MKASLCAAICLLAFKGNLALSPPPFGPAFSLSHPFLILGVLKDKANLVVVMDKEGYILWELI
jgi:hypothetical protein